MRKDSVKTPRGRKTVSAKAPLVTKKAGKTRGPAMKKMTIGYKTSTSKKYDVRICGDCDVADVYHHMEDSVPRGVKVLIFGETDKMYGGYTSGIMGEYFSVEFTKEGGYRIKERVDWEDGIDMVTNKRYSVWHMKHVDLVNVPGYSFKSVRI